MFDLSDWNDNPEALSLSESLVRKKRNIPPSRREAGESSVNASRKKRLKRTKKLLDVLRTLETSHDQEAFIPPQPVDNPVDQHSSRETAASVSEPVSASQCLNRKQWKNRMKNKRRNKNKFRFPEETVPGVPATPQTGAVVEEPRAGLQVHTQTRGKRKPVNAPESPHKGDLPTPPTNPLVPSQQDKWKLQRLKKVLQRSVRGADAAGEPSQPGIKASRGDGKGEDGGAATEEDVIPEDRSAVLRSRMEQRLSSARFRYINQQLYTSHSGEARDLFRGDPEAFIIYHNGFSQQVQRWPVNPITEIIKYIRNRPPSLLVADFGCGDAMLARSVRNKVHSFDLVALNEHVTACDIAEVPLSDETVDVVVFCLSLMGTNFTEFLLEANRVLKMGGVLLVAEVSSRFEDVRSFLGAMAQLGFKNVAKNTEHTYFFLFEFTKIGLPRSSVKHPGLALKPCLYKKR